MKDKILVLGYFGYRTNQLDGQTVKTRDIFHLLQEQYPNRKIDFFDTQDFKYNKLSVLLMFKKLCQSKTLIYLPANNNLKYIFPFIFIFSKICRFDIHYFVVGGWLNSFIKDLPIHKWMLHKIRGIHVETRRLKDDLQTNYGYRNIDIFPNFRFSTPTSNIIRSQSKVLRLVFVSRLCKRKGLDILNKLHEQAKDNGTDELFTVDFYGQKTDEYFDSYLADISNYKYKGILQPIDVIPTLKQYDVLIFPSHYEGEGCPGIMVEALFAGLPIIASNWKYNSEFVEDGVNGILCGTYSVTDYENAILGLLKDAKLIHEMSENALRKSLEYTSQNATKLLKEFI